MILTPLQYRAMGYWPTKRWGIGPTEQSPAFA